MNRFVLSFLLFFLCLPFRSGGFRLRIFTTFRSFLVCSHAFSSSFDSIVYRPLSIAFSRQCRCSALKKHEHLLRFAASKLRLTFLFFVMSLHPYFNNVPNQSVKIDAIKSKFYCSCLYFFVFSFYIFRTTSTLPVVAEDDERLLFFI